MVVGQHPRLGNGGTTSPRISTQTKPIKAWLSSGQIGKKIQKHSIDFNYTTIRRSRFLDREWGGESHFTPYAPWTQRRCRKRKRTSVNGKVSVSPQFKILTAYGKILPPDATNAAQNKYALPSYNQFNMVELHI
jgi:hypothetical protein